MPGAKKPYHLKALFQPELDIYGIASKAEGYNIEADPQVIEKGFTAACELIYYLAADGYKIKTPIFNLSIRLPGEYEGAETHLPEGVYPEARLQASASLRRYIRKRVKVEFDGIDQRDGLIAEALTFLRCCRAFRRVPTKSRLACRISKPCRPFCRQINQILFSRRDPITMRHTRASLLVLFYTVSYFLTLV